MSLSAVQSAFKLIPTHSPPAWFNSVDPAWMLVPMNKRVDEESGKEKSKATFAQQTTIIQSGVWSAVDSSGKLSVLEGQLANGERTRDPRCSQASWFFGYIFFCFAGNVTYSPLWKITVLGQMGGEVDQCRLVKSLSREAFVPVAATHHGKKG